MMRCILLLCATAAIAYSRPGETSAQIEKRFGAPLKKPSDDGGEGRPASAPPVTSSLRETSRIYLFKMGTKDFRIVVYYLDNKSQLERYRTQDANGYATQLEKADIEKILQAASNGAPWNVELEDKSETDPEGKKRTILERGLRERDHAHYKTTGGKAWIEDGELLVETDAFHAFRKAQKPADAAAPASPIPSQGKGF